MRTYTLHAMALLGFVPLIPAAASAEDNQPPAGFTALFNGKDMTGWKADAEGHWRAGNGVMTYDGKAKNLASEKAFDDFILLIDWKIPKGGNSGVFLRGESQVEIWDNHNIGSGGIYPQHHKPLKVADKPAGQWNHFEIHVEKGVVTVQFNGQLVLDRFECNFRKATGPIVLQHHGTPLWFKNIYIKGAASGSRVDCLRVRLGGAGLHRSRHGSGREVPLSDGLAGSDAPVVLRTSRICRQRHSQRGGAEDRRGQDEGGGRGLGSGGLEMPPPAETEGTLSTPWCAVLVGQSEGQLIENEFLVLNLNPPCAIADTSWIVPGKTISDQGNVPLQTGALK